MLRGQYKSPARQAQRRQPRARRRGLSIVEVMISLAITSILLMGVSAAYIASADAVAMNDRFFRATQAARVTMNQLLTEIRRAESVLCAPTNDSIIVTRPYPNRLPDEDSREYMYNPLTKKVTLRIFYKRADGATWSSPIYSLASNMETATFGPPADRYQDSDGAWQEVHIPVMLDVKIGSNAVRLSGSSSPRRAPLKPEPRPTG
jgi:prepilin-type N-terminal cleavage/methylation domain-containing protein